MSARILLVEDDDDDVFLMKRAMQRAGVLEPMQIAWDGREAVEYFQGRGRFGDRNEHPLPGLVLLDWKLPHLTGLDVLKWIRGQDQFRSTIIIVLSASGSREDQSNASRHGANGYLVKPATLDGLDDIARTIRDSWLKTSFSSMQRVAPSGTPVCSYCPSTMSAQPA